MVILPEKNMLFLQSSGIKANCCSFAMERRLDTVIIISSDARR